MKILQLCNKPPFPPRDGHSIAMNELSQGLRAAGHEVKILAIHTPNHGIDPAALPEDYKRAFRPEYVYVDTRIKARDAFKNLFSDDSYNITRFYSPEFVEKLAAALGSGEFDIVQFETLVMAAYLGDVRRLTAARAVLRSHNIEHLLLGRRAGLDTNPLRKRYLQFLAGRLDRYEHDVINRFDAVIPISEVDRSCLLAMGCRVPMRTVAVGFDFDDYDSNVSDHDNTVDAAADGILPLCFIGAMDWEPNVWGLGWFLKNVWPLLSANHPGLRLYCAGRKIGRHSAMLNAPGVVNMGEVPDARRFMKSCGLMIVPLFSGSGIRVKIIEAMSIGKAVATTPVGAEGIDARHGKEILIGSTAREFSDNIEKCLESRAYYDSISAAAAGFARANFDNKIIIQNLVSLYDEII